MIRVLVIANSAVSRAGLEALVRADPRFELAAEGYRAGDVVAVVREYQPDVLLLEAPDPSAWARLHPLPEQPGAPGIVLLATHLGRTELQRALRSGVRAVLPHDVNPVEIAAAIEAVGAGLAVVTPEDMQALLPASAETEDSESITGAPLTTRESEVLALLAEGAGNKEIASRLRISEHTVKFHVSSILGKLDAATRTEAVARGFKEGLIIL